MIAQTPSPPYYAVIFTLIKSSHREGYKEISERMIELVQKQKGFLGYESAYGEVDITISYWKDLESIKKWKENEEHQLAQEKGKSNWYSEYKTRVVKVERGY